MITKSEAMRIQSQSIHNYQDFLGSDQILFIASKLCMQGNKCSPIAENGVPLYLDSNHLTDYSAEKIVYPALREIILRNSIM